MRTPYSILLAILFFGFFLCPVLSFAVVIGKKPVEKHEKKDPVPTKVEIIPEKKPPPETIWIDRFEKKTSESPLKFGWEGGHLEDEKKDFQYHLENGNTFIRSTWLKNEDAEVLKKEFTWDAKAYPYLKWRWRAQKFPIGAKILDDNKSDAVAQIYLLWKSGVTHYVMKYFWASSDPVGTLLEKNRFLVGRVRGLVIRSGGKTGEWYAESRNVYEDFKKFFESEPPGPVKGIAILSDADATKTQSEADYDDIEVSKIP